jgi:hypothetical protein
MRMMKKWKLIKHIGHSPYRHRHRHRHRPDGYMKDSYNAVDIIPAWLTIEHSFLRFYCIIYSITTMHNHPAIKSERSAHWRDLCGHHDRSYRARSRWLRRMQSSCIAINPTNSFQRTQRLSYLNTWYVFLTCVWDQVFTIVLSTHRNGDCW